MKYIFILIGPISYYPPALTAIQVLNDLGKDVTVLCSDINQEAKEIFNQKNIKYKELYQEFNLDNSLFTKLKRIIKLRKRLWREIDSTYNSETILWVASDISIKYLGSKLLTKKYILQLYELQENILYTSKYPQFKIELSKYANKALSVIEAEYNRAYIAKTWWNLDETPFVLPNKPYIMEIDKNSTIRDKRADQIIKKLENKKIILYQGGISKERPLEKIIQAVDSLGDDYAFVVMSGEEDAYANINSSNYYFIPFVNPPFHLEITSHAYIGVLSYTAPKTNSAYSKLNTVYCAPNKIYEYASFGVPMIGNDIPGLVSPFKTYGIGEDFHKFEEKQVVEAILKIESKYESYSTNAEKFFEKTDLYQIIDEITIRSEFKLMNKRI